MTYPDWQVPVQLLELSTGPVGDAQYRLATRVGLMLDGTEPYSIAAVMLEEHLHPLIWGTCAQGATAYATERQRRFLKNLGASQANERSLSKVLASAWIDYYLARRNIDRLRTLQLCSGNAVIKAHRWNDPLTEVVYEILEYQRVSSIGANGLVFFKGGNGKCGWPSALERPSVDADSKDYPRCRVAGGDVA